MADDVRYHKVTEDDIREAKDRLELYGYAPDPFCHRCGGSGLLHPVKGGKAIYQQTISCPEEGCLAKSFTKYKYKY